MNITIIRHSIRSRGGDRLVLDYCDYLIGQGHVIEYYTNKINTPFVIHPQIKIKKIFIPGILGTMLFTLFKKFSSDIVWVDLVIMACLASVRNKEKVLYLAQDYDVSYYEASFQKRLTRFAYSLALKRFGVFTVCVSQGLADILKQYRPHNIQTVSNGVNLNLFYRDGQSGYLSEKKKTFTILLFARSDYRKGLDIGIQALKELSRIRGAADWELWTIGDELVDIPDIPVRSFGFLKTAGELKNIFSATDIYLVPSRSEGLSLLLLQALACQCAVVATQASCILHNGKDALVSPIEDWQALGENMNRVLNDQVLREALQVKARQLAKQYSFEESCQKFEHILEEFK